MGHLVQISFNLVLFVFLINFSDAVMDKTLYRSITAVRDCFGRRNPGLCLKERAFEALNETIMSDKAISLYDLVKIERNPDYRINTSIIEQLPQDISARSMKLTDILHDQVEQFFKSRTIRFNMAANVEEGRGKKDKGGKGGMVMMAMGGMACMMAQMFMGKMAFMAGSALILAKVALFLSAIIGLKKMSSGGGGGESHVVYASEGGHGGGGGWHRSLDADAAHNLAYRAHTSAPTGY